MSFNEDEAVDVVRADTIASSVWVENEATSSAYGDLFDRTARRSLARRDSIRLIEAVRHRLNHPAGHDPPRARDTSPCRKE
ncbi:Scr1 family TA system antitoxin-like transcriptional regulator [Streptomyces sp. NPDC000348]|uniref:Scr1 family TA system antitoxin-like transcriptional regulator n=1 Tax=Streptomyces sp. NPDC000348 TaxID=3364538 RepID=UPI00367D5B18